MFNLRWESVILSTELFRINELYNFVRVFWNFNAAVLIHKKKFDEEDIYDDHEKDSNYDQDSYNSMNEKKTALLDCLALFCCSKHKFVDAFPSFCKKYWIAVAIPVTSATSQCIFSSLKREVKSSSRA